MEKLSRETIEKWAKEQNWLQVAEGANPNGKQITYLSPSGRDVIFVYDLEGNLFGFGHMVQSPPQMPGHGFLGYPGPGFLGKA
jgi:hypothetical protein